MTLTLQFTPNEIDEVTSIVARLVMGRVVTIQVLNFSSSSQVFRYPRHHYTEMTSIVTDQVVKIRIWVIKKLQFRF